MFAGNVERTAFSLSHVSSDADVSESAFSALSTNAHERSTDPQQVFGNTARENSASPPAASESRRSSLDNPPSYTEYTSQYDLNLPSTSANEVSTERRLGAANFASGLPANTQIDKARARPEAKASKSGTKKYRSVEVQTVTRRRTLPPGISRVVHRTSGLARALTVPARNAGKAIKDAAVSAIFRSLGDKEHPERSTSPLPIE